MKEKNTTRNRSLAREALRILETVKVTMRSSTTKEEELRKNLHMRRNCCKETETALLEAERKKAEVLMEWKRRSCNY